MKKNRNIVEVSTKYMGQRTKKIKLSGKKRAQTAKQESMRETEEVEVSNRPASEHSSF